MAPRKCCVPSCTVTQGSGVALHRFPNPSLPNEIERFRTWVMKIGGDIVGEDNLFIHRNRRICHRHFEEMFTFPNNRLTLLAIPTLHIPGVHVGPLRSMPMDFVEQALQPLVTSTQPVIIKAPEAIPSTSKAVPSTSKASLKYDVHATQQQQMQMDLDDPQATSAKPDVVAQTQAPVAIPSTSKVSLTNRVLRQRVSKPLSESERQLRDTLSETKIKLWKCKTSKELLKTKLLMANKIMKSSAYQLLSEKMSPAAQTFFGMQIKQFDKKPRGRRFTLEEKILALSVYKPSPKSYKLLSKICILPKRRTLDKMLKRIQLLPGINEIVFQHLKKRVNRMSTRDRLCTLVFDEMSITPHVAFDKRNDAIHGFVDNGTNRKNEFCDHVLVFMVRGIVRKFKQPVAFSYCSGSTPTVDLKNQLEIIIKKVMETGLNIVATVCDQGSTNMAALNMLMNNTKANYLKNNDVYRGGFFEVNNKKIYPIYDPPHLMKGIRNNLLNKDLEYEEEGKRKIAKWAHLEAAYRREPKYKGVRVVNKLTAQHVVPSMIPKMRVKFCTQVFSKTVGVTMGYLANNGKLPKESKDTADLLLFFDKLFDSVNGSFSEPVNEKIYRSAVTPGSPHHQLWHRSLPILKSMKYISKNGNKRGTVPSITSWVKTIEAFQHIFKTLHSSMGINSLLLRHFNQDPIENFFGSIRAHGLRNVKPSAMSFLASYKALLLSNLTSPHSVGSNCEDDETECLQSLKYFLTRNVTSNSKEDLITVNENHIYMSELDIDNIIKNQKAKSAAIAYCSGWLVHKLRKIYKNCKKCRGDLESLEMQEFHEYIKIKEYRSDKSWLCYPTREVFNYFCQVENIVIEILQSHCHITKISEYIELIVSMNLDLNFISCTQHKKKVGESLLKKSIIFFINNWCREINEILSGRTKYWDETDTLKQAAHSYYVKHKNYNKDR